VYAKDFTIFEEMAGVNLKKDFRDVTPLHENYTGQERRKKVR